MTLLKYASLVEYCLKSGMKIRSNCQCFKVSQNYSTCVNNKIIYHRTGQYRYQTLKFNLSPQLVTRSLSNIEPVESDITSEWKNNKSLKQDWILALQNTDNYLGREEWESRRNEYLDLFGFKPYTCYWYVQLMMILKHVQTARSLYHYQCSFDPEGNMPVAFQTHYLNILSKEAEQYEDEIFSIYNRLKENIDIFDYSSCILLVKSLSKTRHWRECLNLLQMAKVTQKKINSSLLHGCTAAAALQENDLHVFKEMTKILNEENQILTSVVFERLQWMKASYNDTIKTLLNAVMESKAPVPEDSYQYVKDYFER